MGRALVQRRHIQWRIVALYIIGAVFGAYIGGQFVTSISELWFRIILGSLLLVLIWTPKQKKLNISDPLFIVSGFISAFFGMLTGTGLPLHSLAVKARSLSKHQVIATIAGSKMFMHSFKSITFGLLGFAFAPWLPLIAAMIGSGFLSTLAGSHLLDQISEEKFTRIFKIVLTLIALNILRKIWF